MTVKEALSHMEYVKEIINQEVPWTKSAEALDVAIEALVKQIPKKLLSWYGSEKQCGTCNSCFDINIYRGRCCPQCGQVIDWSEEGE